MPLVQVSHLVKHFVRGKRLLRPGTMVRAVDDVSFDIERGRDVRPGRRIRQRKDDDGPLSAAAGRTDVGIGDVPG